MDNSLNKKSRRRPTGLSKPSGLSKPKRNDSFSSLALSDPRSLASSTKKESSSSNSMMLHFLINFLIAPSEEQIKQCKKRKIENSVQGSQVMDWLQSNKYADSVINAIDTAEKLCEADILQPAEEKQRKGTFHVNGIYIIHLPATKPLYIESDFIAPPSTSFQWYLGEDHTLIKLASKINERDVFKLKREVQLLQRFPSAYFISPKMISESNSAVQVTNSIVPRGESVFERLSRRETFSEAQVMFIVKEIAKALCVLHEKNYIYGHLTLQSIYVHTQKSGELSVSLLDAENWFRFGKRANPLNRATIFCAPEIVNGGSMSVNSDMWSLGVCLHWLLFGYPPFVFLSSSVLSSIFGAWKITFHSRQTISPTSRILILHLLNHNPDRRVSAAELANWPEDIIVNNIRYPFGIWHSLKYTREEFPLMNASEANSNDASAHVLRREKLKTFIGLGPTRKSTSVLLINPVDILFLGYQPQMGDLVKFSKPTLENLDPYTFQLSDQKVTLHLFDPAIWQPQFNKIYNILFIADLHKIGLNHINGTRESLVQALSNSLAQFEQIWSSPFFCDKIRSKTVNSPITIIYYKFDYLIRLIKDNQLESQWFGFKPDSGQTIEEAVKETLQALFTAIKHRVTLPRLVYHDYLAGSNHESFLSLLQTQSRDFSQASESMDFDGIISRATKNNMERVNIGYPFIHRKVVKISGFPTIAEALHSSSCNIKELNFHNLQLRDNTVEILVSALQENRSLTRINFSNNQLFDKGLSSLCNGLKGHPQLQSLIIAEIQCTKIGASVLGRILETLPKLELLDISGNSIGDDGVISIVESVMYHQGISILHFQRCELYEASLLVITQLLETHPSLSHMNLEGNRIPQSWDRKFAAAIKSNVAGKFSRLELGPGFSSKKIDRVVQARKKILGFNSKIAQNINLYSSDPFKIIEQTKPHKNIVRLCSCELSSFPLPENYAPFSSVTFLDLSGNSLLELPESLNSLGSLRILHAEQNLIEQIKSLGQLKQLEELYLQNNRLEKISTLVQNPSLKLIDVRWNVLRALPALEELPLLETLLLDNNGLVTLPSGIFSLTNLNNLSVFKNHIVLVKAIIYQCWSREMRLLDLSNFGLKCLPKDIELLSALQELDLSQNQLVGFPPQIANLSSLRVLNISDNLFPNDLALSPLYGLELSKLILKGNSGLSSQMLSASTWNEIKSLFPDPKSLPSHTYLNRAKLMIVGQKQTGKTSLANMLTQCNHSKNFFRKAEELLSQEYTPTDGISIMDWNDPDPNSDAFLMVWDFAGLDAYKITHAFFLEERSIYLVVFDLTAVSEVKRKEIAYWVKVISVSAPKSPILLVGTHADLLQPDEPEQVAKNLLSSDQLRDCSGNITNLVLVNNFALEDMERLRDTILDKLRAQPYVQRKMHYGYLSLMQLILSERHLTIRPIASIAEFEHMISECNIDGSAQTIAENLTLLGLVSYFNDKKLGVGSSVVLDPSWLVNLITTIITVRETGITDGYMYHNKIPKIFSKYPASLYTFIINLFNQIELIYTCPDPHPIHGAYSIVPSLLPIHRPATVEIDFMMKTL